MLWDFFLDQLLDYSDCLINKINWYGRQIGYISYSHV